MSKLYHLLDRRDRLKLVFLLILMIANAGFESLSVGVIPGLILMVTQPEKIVAIPVAGDHLQAWYKQAGNVFFIWFIVAIFLLFLIKNAFLIFLYKTKGSFGRDLQITLGSRLLRKYLYAPYEFHISSNSAELLRNINGEVSQVVNQVVMQFLLLLLNFFVALGILSLLFATEPLISVASMGLFGLISFSFLRLTKNKIKFYGSEAVSMRKQKNKIVLNSLHLVKEIKILGKEAFFSDKYQQTLKKEAYVTLHKAVTEKIPKALMEVMAAGLMFSIIVFLILSDRDLEAMVPILALYAVAAVKLMPAANLISTSVTNIRYALPSVDPIYHDLTRIKEEDLTENSDFGNVMNGTLRVSNLRFSYQKQAKVVLKDVSFEVKLGKTIAFVGPSGAGKTTLVDILLGILKPTHGTLHCSGKPITSDIASWRKKVGYIPQQITLINDTVLHNICLGEEKNNIDMERVMQAVRQAKLDETLAQLPHGLDTPIGDKGVRLSGGQRQRVGIARALYYNPAILVMDEATSALDNITEKEVIDSIDLLKDGRTIIMIAHRLTTVQKCDVIYFLKDGEIIAQGTYSELINTNQEFQKMALV